jgi:hypothetical protein
MSGHLLYAVGRARVRSCRRLARTKRPDCLVDAAVAEALERGGAIEFDASLDKVEPFVDLWQEAQGNVKTYGERVADVAGASASQARACSST